MPVELVYNKDEVAAYLARVWPQALGLWEVESLTASFARLIQPTSDTNLRPGGTVSGPTMMSLADAAAYVLVLGLLGDAALAVTSSMSMDFLRRPTLGVLIAEVELHKLGRSLVTSGVKIFSASAWNGPDSIDRQRPVATGSFTYSRSLVEG